MKIVASLSLPPLPAPGLKSGAIPMTGFRMGWGMAQPLNLARDGCARRRDARKAEVLLPTEAIWSDHVVALDRRVPDRVRGPHVSSGGDVGKAAHDAAKARGHE